MNLKEGLNVKDGFKKDWKFEMVLNFVVII